jgi:phosphohistidine phosphatase
MQLCLIRHALAGERTTFAKTGRPDDLRPITPSGRRNTRDSLPTLRALLPWVDVVATSPLARALQTAEIVATAYPSAERETLDALRPGGREKELLRWVRSRDASDAVAMVGHDPDLSEFASWLLSGRKGRFVAMEKGAALVVEFGRRVEPGRAKLLWAVPPRVLVRG